VVVFAITGSRQMCDLQHTLVLLSNFCARSCSEQIIHCKHKQDYEDVIEKRTLQLSLLSRVLQTKNIRRAKDRFAGVSATECHLAGLQLQNLPLACHEEFGTSSSTSMAIEFDKSRHGVHV
jgi:hypothetical protein